MSPRHRRVPPDTERRRAMNWVQLESRWSEFAGSARAHWSRLTDEDSVAIAGRREQLVALVQERYAVSREAAEHQVDEWFNAMLDIAEPVKRR